MAREWTQYHVTVFFLTYFTYATMHAVRKTLSNVKTTLSDEWTPCSSPYAVELDKRSGFRTWGIGVNRTSMASVSETRTRNLANPIKNKNGTNEMLSLNCPHEHAGILDIETVKMKGFLRDYQEAEQFLGVLDSSFLFVYGLGLFISGFIADRNDLRFMLTGGLVLTSVVTFVFGPIVQWSSSFSRSFYVALMVLNGLVQSVGWPCVVAVMGSWFGQGSRGLVLGLWSSCQSVGNIVGALIVSVVLDYGYEYAFLVTSSLTLACAFLVFFGLVPTPRELGLPADDDENVLYTAEKIPATNSDGSVASESVVSKETSFSSTADTISLGRIDSANMTKTSKLHGSSLPMEVTHSIKELEGEDFDSKIAEDSQLTAESDTIIPKPSAIGRSATGPERTSQKRNANTTEWTPNSSSNRTAVNELGESDPVLRAAERPALSSGTVRHEAVGFLTALLLPGVVPYSFTFVFLKLVHYAFFFWLPFYLTAAFGWREADAGQLSVWYDVGSVVGGTAAGFLSDRFERRAVVHVPMLLLGLGLLHLYGSGVVGQQVTGNAVLLGAIGVFSGGVAIVVPASVSVDLCRQDVIGANKGALSTVSGIVDGSGTLGAAVGQVIIPFLQVRYGWRSVFYLFEISTLLAIISLLPVLVAEVGPLLASRWYQRHEQRRADEDGLGDEFLEQAEGHRNPSAAGAQAVRGKMTTFFHTLCNWGGSICETKLAPVSSRDGVHLYRGRGDTSDYHSFNDKATK